MSNPCEQEQNIAEIKNSINGTNESLKELVTEFRSEFKELMSDLRVVLEDNREHRTEIKQLRKETDLQWEKITGLGKRQDEIVGKLIKRVGDTELTLAEMKGRHKVYMLIPTVMAVICAMTTAVMAVLRYTGP